LPFLKTAFKSNDAEQRRRAEALHAQIYESWIQMRAERAAKYGIDVIVERMVHRGKDLTEEEWDVFANIVEKIRAETKWRETLPRKKYLQLPITLDPNDKDPRLRASRLLTKGIVRSLETDGGIHNTLAICNGDVKVVGGISSAILFVNGDIHRDTTINSSLVVCDGIANIYNVPERSVIISRGSVNIVYPASAKYTTILDNYRNSIPGLRFFFVSDLGLHLSGDGKKYHDMVSVATLQKDSLLEKAGIKAGDVISSINGKEFTHPDQARRLFRNAMATGHIEIGLERNKRFVRVEILW
jgi:PDZ domain